jgi:hypothetical protein
MKLESVLALKAELKDDVAVDARLIPKPVAAALGARGATARSIGRQLDASHTRAADSVRVALGVAAGRKRGDFQLGARVQTRGPAGRRLAEEIARRARGEADVKIVPKVGKRAPSPSWFRRRRRPLEAGISIGHYNVTAGTLGFIVEDQHAYYALSNNHVLADVNAGRPGDPVIQPGALDIAGRTKVSTRTMVGVLDRFVPMSFVRANVVDCALAALLPELDFWVGWTEAIPGRVRGLKPVTFDDLGRPVAKAGRTTGVTRGTITQVNIDRLQVDMGDTTERIALFSDQIEVEGTGRAFSDGGDSGSLIVDDAGFARALLFAGGRDEDTDRDLTFANLLDVALQKLGVTLVL